jgi:hypothetical protein
MTDQKQTVTFEQALETLLPKQVELSELVNTKQTRYAETGTTLMLCEKGSADITTAIDAAEKNRIKALANADEKGAKRFRKELLDLQTKKTESADNIADLKAIIKNLETDITRGQRELNLANNAVARFRFMIGRGKVYNRAVQALMSAIVDMKDDAAAAGFDVDVLLPKLLVLSSTPEEILTNPSWTLKLENAWLANERKTL